MNRDFRGRLLSAHQYEREKEYWLNKLSGEPEKTFITPDVVTQGEVINRMDSYMLKFPVVLFEKLLKISNNSDSRLLIILVTGLNLLLYKYMGNKDIIIITPIYKQDVEGKFINTILPLRSEIDEQSSVKEFLMQVKRTVNEAGENQNYPIETICYELGITPAEREFSFCDTAVLLRNIQDKQYISHIDLNMIFSFLRTEESLEGIIEYNASIFEKNTILRIANYFIHVMHEAFFDTDLKLVDIPLLSEEEKKILVFDFNNTATDFPDNKMIHQLFEAQAEKTPDRIAIESRDEILTYKALNEKADRLARLLRENGIGNETVAAIMLDISIDVPMVVMAVLKAGGAYLPLGFEYPEDRINYMLSDSRAKIVLTRKSLVESKYICCPLLFIGDENHYICPTDSVENIIPVNSVNSLVYIIYTSGTTGKPKGVMIEHKGLVNYLWWAARQYVGNEKLDFPLYTSISFDLTVTSVFTPLITGNTIIVYGDGGKDKKLNIENVIDDNRVGVVKLTPSHLKLIRSRCVKNSIIKRLIVGGEELETSLARDIYNNFDKRVEIYNEYGPTETVVGSMIYKFNPPNDTRYSVPIGVPIANTQVYLLDRNHRHVPLGVEGEIYIGGSGVARGYLNHPELTADRFPSTLSLAEKIYRTGDLGGRLANGNIEYKGRMDHQVKIRGFRIELGEIECRLCSYAGINEAVVVCRDHEKNDKFLCAYIVSIHDIEAAALREFLFAFFPDYMIPMYYTRIDRIPLTSSGKVDRKALPDPELTVGAEYRPPRGAVEEALCRIWSEVLGLDKEKISIDSSFFEIGGHSLRATFLAAAIQKEFNVKLPLVKIFEFPTIRGQGEIVKESAQEMYTAIENVEEKEYYVLSSAQKRLYILQQMDLDSTAYNVPLVVELDGDWDREKLLNTFEALLDRHESVRTSFPIVDDTPVQVVNREVDFKIEDYDFSPTRGETIIKGVIRPFDLSKAPLMRVGLVKLDSGSESGSFRQILVVDFHHIITDGISHPILINDLISLYNDIPLLGLKLQYKDYSEWEQSSEVKHVLKKQEEYWLKEFEDPISVIDIPTDYSRPAIQSFEGNRIEFKISEVEINRLNEIARSEGATLFMGLLAVFNIFLSKICRQEDITVGIPVAGRRHADLNGIIGMFVNTLVLRNYVPPEETFASFLGKVKEKALNAFENQDYQYETLVDKIAVQRDMSRNPLFDVLFMFQDIIAAATPFSNAIKEEKKEDLKIKPYNYEHKTSKFDLTLMVTEAREELYFSFEYCKRLFSEETLLRFIRYFKKIISFVIEDIGRKISDIEIISEEEREKILVEFNATEASYPQHKTIHKLFEEQVKQAPDHIAVVYSYYHVTYLELNEKSTVLAHELRESGIGPDMIAAIMTERSIDMIIGILGILKTGGAYLPIDPNYPPDRINYLINDSGARITLTADTISNALESPNFPSSPLNNMSENINSSYFLAYAIYTSGSTGKPKGVLIEHHAVVNFLFFMQRSYPFKCVDTYLLKTPYSFDVSVSELFGWYLEGGRLSILKSGDEKDPHALLDSIEKHRISHINFIPSMFNVFLEYISQENKHRLSSLKYVFLAGEAILPSIGVKLIHLEMNIVVENLYGPTEGTVYVSYFSLSQWDKTVSIPIGKPVFNNHLYIFDKYMNIQPIGIPGELCISGTGLSRGYLNRSELTAERFIPLSAVSAIRTNTSRCTSAVTKASHALYKTGDFAKWLPDGNIEFLGRIDYQVKIRGFRIELGEIESLLLTYPEIKEAVVVVSEAKNEDKRLCAYIVSDKKYVMSELREFLLKELPYYMIPSHFMQIEKIPLTPNGKVDRVALGLNIKQLSTGITYVAPQNDTQQKIIDIWKDVLNLDEIGIHDNYFDVGGTSFDILKINKRLIDTFQVDIPILVMFRHTTVDSIEKYLSNKIGEAFEKTEDIKKEKFQNLKTKEDRKIAVIGMDGKFPCSKNLNEFWNNIKHGNVMISFFSDEELRKRGISNELLNNTNYVKAAGILDDIEYFDASFFGYTPKEAEIMDPQIRLFHECVWNALENAGYDPGQYKGIIGLYAGAGTNIPWQTRVFLSGREKAIGDFAASQLISKEFLTLRVSYKLDLKGPSFVVSSTCSTSLVAVHTACQAIWNGECNMAIAGGIRISYLEKSGYIYQEGMILSPDGHCRAFSANAKGTVGSDGAGVVVLKPLEDAILDRDHIYAVIKGTAINNDGIKKSGFSAPSVEGQSEVIRTALHLADVEAESIGYIETHGTGTELGDPVEIEALKLAFNTGKKSFCAIGSVKSNIGHTDAAAGVAGLIKTILALKYQVIPASLDFETPNPYIDFIESPFYVNTKLVKWEKSKYPRRAGVSSFGIGGTNVHVILEEWLPQHRLPIHKQTGIEECQLFPLSAKTEFALDKMKKNFADYLKIHLDVNLEDVSYTLQMGRKAFAHRWITACFTVDELIEALSSPGAGSERLTETGKLWLNGQQIDWHALYSEKKPYRISLPTYPFEKQKYWIDFENASLMSVIKKQTEPIPDIADWFYIPTWKNSTLEFFENNNPPVQLCWLIFMTESNLENIIRKRLEKMYRNVVVVKIGPSFSQENDYCYALNPAEYLQYEYLIEKLRMRGLLPEKIVHWWNVTWGEENLDDYKAGTISFEKNLDTGFFSLMNIAKAIGKQDFNHEIGLHVVTNHAQEVIGDEPLNPGKSVVLGLLKVIPQEFAGIRCSSQDIKLPQPGSLEEEKLADYLLEEFSISSDCMDSEIAYRNNQRWTQIFEPLHLAAPLAERLKLRIREKGVFLITGGLGKIGLMFAELFVKRTKARLILTGRSPFPSGEQSLLLKKLEELEAMGGEIIYIQSDVADLEQMRTVIYEAEKRFGPINGIIHAAGFTEGRSIKTIRDLTPEDSWEQFKPKVLGVLVLGELFKNKPLDFCWLLSSISCVLGGLGFGAYASANRFMDAFVKKHNRSNPRYPRWLSLNWDGMDISRSIDIFERIFTLTKTNQLTVSREGNLHERIDRWIKLKTVNVKDRIKEETLTPSHPRPALSVNYIAPRNLIEETLVKIWKNLLGFDLIGVQDDFLELGGDSLNAITVISRIHKELGVNIPVMEFFNRPTIQGLAEYILSQSHIGENTYISIEPAEEKVYYDLSSAQERLFSLQQIQPDSKGYNLFFIYILEEGFSKTRIKSAITNLIERHESLRTSFHLIGNNPAQKIHCMDLLKFQVQYFEAMDEIEANEIVNNFNQPFDLSQAPLLRVGVIQIGNGEYSDIFMIDMHHIISDGVSLDIFVNDFMRFYKSPYIRGENELTPLHLQYKDFSEWQNSEKKKGAINKQEEYWLERFQGEIPIVNIPTDYMRPSVQSFEGNAIDFELGIEETRRLNEIARAERGTLFMVLLAIYNIFLAKMSNQEDIVVGTPVAGRRHADLEKIIGIFVNTIVLRNYPQGGRNFIEYFQQVKNQAVEGFENQDYQFEDLVKKVAVKRDMSRNPIFDIMFVWQNTFSLSPSENILRNDADSLKIKSYNYRQRIAKFDLTLIVTEAGEKLHFSFEYCTRLFNEATILRFIGYFKNILSSLVETTAKKISDIEIISEEERKKILFDFNDTEAAYPKNKMIHELFEEQVNRIPDHIAVIFSSLGITYKELNEKSQVLALELREKGIVPDSIAAMMMERSIDMIIGILGILKAGGSYLPIDPDYPEERKQYMLKDSGATLLIMKSNFVELTNLSTSQLPSFTGKRQPVSSLAYIIYTSGTTGNPKGALIEHRNVVRLLFNERFQFDFNERDIWTMFHSYCFDFSVWEMYGALLYGGKLSIISKMTARDPQVFLKILRDHQVTVLNQTPSSFYNLSDIELNRTGNDLDIRYIIFGGEALSPSRLKGWKSKYPECKLINMFGITETTVHVTYKEIGEKEIELGVSNIGIPIPTLSTYVLNKYLRLTPPGVIAELFVGGEGVARGYLNQPELTGEKFIENPYKPEERLYRSGDLGNFSLNGDLHYMGRADYQVKIRGFRIELGEIESRVINHPGIKDAAVIFNEQENKDKYLCAYIVMETINTEVSIPDLREYLSKYLPDYMIPAYFIKVEKIPLTSNGKIDHKTLSEIGGKDLSGNIEYIKPGNKIEAALAEIWEKVLERDCIGINDNFFNIGGDSIKAIRVVSSINNNLQTDIKIVDIFTSNTIRELAKVVINSTIGEQEKELEEVEKEIEDLRQRVKQSDKIPKDVEDVFPMSDIEKGMVFHAYNHTMEAIYHDQFVYFLKYNDFEPDTLKRALELMAEKHSILRTSYNVEDFNEAVHFIHKPFPAVFKHVNISGLESPEQQQYIRSYMEEDRRNRWNITFHPLWRMATFGLGNDDICAVWTFHHAILDGWSNASLMTELNNTYLELKANRNYNPGSLRISYKDFIIQEMVEKKKQENIDFWTRELEDYKRVIFPDTAKSDESRHHIFNPSIDSALNENIVMLPKQYNISLKHVCFAAYLYMISMLTYENDVVVGLISNNRPEQEDGDKLIGCFLNTLPFRITIPTGVSCEEYIRMVDEKLLMLKQYEKITFYEIVRAIGERNCMENPILDTIFNYIDFHIYKQAVVEDSRTANDFGGKFYGYEMTNTLFNLTISPHLKGISVAMSYSPSFITIKTVEKLSGYFLSFLKLMISGAETVINKDGIISNEEKKKLLYEFNDTEVFYFKDKTIHGLFEEQVNLTPDHTAIVYRSRQVSYRELNEKSEIVARKLREIGVTSGSIAAISIERSIEMITGIWGILKTGAAYLPIDPNYPKDRIDFMLKNSGATVFITKNDFEEIPDFPLMQSTDNRLLATSLAYIIYTSGSTGKPKGVCIEHHSVINRLNWMQKAYPIGEEDVILQKTTFTFDVSVWELFWWALQGASVCLLNPGGEKDPEEIVGTIEKKRISVLHFVPSMLNIFLEYIESSGGRSKLSSLRRVFASGEVLLLNHVERFNRLVHTVNQAELINLYGPTEATVDVSYFNCSMKIRLFSIPIGMPIDNIGLYIIDNAMQLQPVGITGELCISGVGLARGYLNNPELTAAKFVNSPLSIPDCRLYRTGDLARWLDDGNIEFIGRIDSQVKIRGFRIELGEIETRLSSHPGIKDAVIMDKADGQMERYLCAYIVSDHDIAVSELREYLLLSLPEYMIPSYFMRLGKIPLSANGKIDRKALPTPEIAVGEGYVPPRNQVEEKLIEIWAEVLNLGKEKIGINDNFFQLGGHSLKATIMVLRIHKELNVRVPMDEIFKTPTIKGLIQYIIRTKGEHFLLIDAVEKKEYYPLSSAQKRLYVTQMMEEMSTNYNIPMISVLVGKIEFDFFRCIFNKLLLRHESLRTSFLMIDDKPAQRIHEKVDLEIEYSIVIGNEKEEEVKEKEIVKNFIRAFNLNTPPLLRVGLIKKEEMKYILMVDMNHIISDAISINILIKDFMDLYAGKDLNPLRVQYKDFSEWQNRLFESGSMNCQEEYWTNRLKDYKPILLPVDFPRPPIRKNLRGSTIQFQVEKALTQKLSDLTSKTNTTLYMVLLTVFNILLHKYTNQEEIIVGTPTAGRHHSDLENLIGMFISILVMRNRTDKNKTFLDLLWEVKKNAIDAYENQDYQFEHLISRLGLQSTFGRNPLFDVVFAVMNVENTVLDIPELIVTPYPYENDSTKFDLRLEAFEMKDIIGMTLTYSVELFKESTMRIMAGHFIEVLNQVLENTNIMIADIVFSHDLSFTKSNTLDEYKDTFEF